MDIPQCSREKINATRKRSTTPDEIDEIDEIIVIDPGAKTVYETALNVSNRAVSSVK